MEGLSEGLGFVEGFDSTKHQSCKQRLLSRLILSHCLKRYLAAYFLLMRSKF